jgi:hypothetical protein
MFKVNFRREAYKYALKMPENIQIKLDLLIEDLKNDGVIQSKWSNYSKLTNNRHHCHLNPKYVVIWIELQRQITESDEPDEPDEYDQNVEILITYVGTRGDAPY